MSSSRNGSIAGPRAASPSNPRPSTSSTRSRFGPEEFEAALLNPNHTVYLMGSSPIDEEPQSTSTPRRARGSEENKDGTPRSMDHKRSFEDDMRSLGSGTESMTPRKNHGLGMGRVPGLGVVPATPSSAPGHSRQMSIHTVGSEGTPTKSRVKGKSLGLDAEIAAEQASKSVTKRRSIFRSPGTASSPDLATLVKRAKERKPIPPLPSIPQATVAGKKPEAVQAPPSPAGPSYSYRSTEMSPERRSVSSGNTGTVGRARRDSGDAEGQKSMRNKARGMFGRMFGSSSSKEQSPPGRPFPAPPTEPALPAVPPIPAPFVAEVEARRQAKLTPEPEVQDDEDLANYPTHSLSAVPETAVATFDAPQSPEILEEVVDEEKPLPDAPAEDVPTTKSSHHVRQPAYSVPELDEEITSPRQRERSFSEDVAGLFANIGQESPARGLGLAPDTVRGMRGLELDETRSTPKQLQAELGRSASSSAHASPYLESSRLKPLPAPVPGRSSSLPSPSLQRTGSARITSSPDPSRSGSRPPSGPSTPRLEVDEHGAFTVLEPKHAHAHVGRELDYEDANGTIKSRVRSQLESPVAPSVRLVGSPRMDNRALDGIDVTADEVARSSFSRSPKEGDMEHLHEPLEVPSIRTPNGEDEVDDEEKGRRLACEFLENDFSHVSEDKVAMLLGGPRPVNSYALKYYMQYFDMKGQNLVEAFRELCQKLVLKAESQEIDRIIEGFSARYYDCNPNSVFGTSGVIHTITGAMLMLNTDLHIAELSKHMSRADFIRNAMSAIRESMPSDGASTPDLIRDDNSSIGNGTIRSRTPNAMAQRSASAPVMPHSAKENRPSGSSTTLTSMTYSKAWEAEAENALRDIYAAVRADRILLPTSTSNESNRQSVISLAGSLDFSRRPGARSASDRVSVLKRGSVRIPGNNSPYGTLAVGSDGRLSPTGSFATSIGDAYSPFASLGFASNLSHSVIKEQEDEIHSTSSRASLSTVDELDDDELALLGAPWAKEGLLWHKMYMEAAGKRAKKNEWLQYFTVVQKGELHMFTFGSGSSGFMGGSVGGGNWLNNAKPVGTIDLMHTLASPVPKGGVADRPYCFSLTVSTGQVTLFQAGTEDLVTEWIGTCNYWSARRSRQPLAGGVSNMEYGWQRVNDLSHDDHDDKHSIRSARSNLSKFGGTYGRKSMQPLDRVHINDWKPPPAANIASPLDEEQQLEALQAYLRSLVEEMNHHKAIEDPMIRQFSHGSKNLAKARDNWRARSVYLHTEIVKYNTYLDSLRSAISLRLKKAGERKLEKSLARSMTSLHRAESDMALDRVGNDD